MQEQIDQQKLQFLNKKNKMIEDLESKAVRDLASLQQEDQEIQLFHPYKSVAISQHTKNNQVQTKQKTIYFKQKTSETQQSQTTRREILKKQLQLYDGSKDEQQENDTRKRVQTSTTVYSMQNPVLGVVGDKFNKYNGFPAQAIKKQPERMWTLKKLEHKQNSAAYQKIQIEDLIRLDIKKKFKIRQSARESERMTKINNFLKMVSTPKQNATAISFKNQDKLKKTLHNILS